MFINSSARGIETLDDHRLCMYVCISCMRTVSVCLYVYLYVCLYIIQK